jgi:hypothetical protein
MRSALVVAVYESRKKVGDMVMDTGVETEVNPVDIVTRGIEQTVAQMGTGRAVTVAELGRPEAVGETALHPTDMLNTNPVCDH